MISLWRFKLVLKIDDTKLRMEQGKLHPTRYLWKWPRSACQFELVSR